MNGSASFDYSENGVLVFRRGVGTSGLRTLQWLDGAGTLRPLPAKPGVFESPRLSPDGKLVALTVDSGSGPGIRVYDLQRDLVTQLTYDEGYNPVWSPDSRHIVFVFNAGGMFWTRADGASNPQPLTRTKDRQIPFSFSPDGKRLAFMQLNPVHGWELWTVAIENQRGQFQAGEPEIFLQTSADIPLAAFSPDGRWLAYMSAGPVNSEIYVRTFPDKGLRWQVSNNGGRFPVWSRNGRELFYVSEDMQIMVIDYEVKGDSFAAGKPRQWCEKRLASTGTGGPILDIAPDGKSFLVLVPVKEAEDQNRVTFLLNFFDELRRRVPEGAK
jgi:eukaryotic-like serine/threonine-protein kinase